MLLYVFEIIIFGWLIAAAIIAYHLIRSFFYKKNERKISRLLIAGLLILSWLIVFYGSFIEPRELWVNNVEININKTESAQRIRIAAVSDSHFGPFKKYKYSQKIADALRAQNPDVIVLLGDYIYGDEGNHKYLAPILELSKDYPMYLISGNHEYHLPGYNDPKYKDKTGTLKELLENYPAKLLENENEKIVINGESFYLAGVKEYWTGNADINAALKGTNRTEPIILLAHNPDFIAAAQDKVDLMLSGHTHGGQIRLPLIGPVSPIPDELGRQYDQGLFDFDQTQIFITSGVGEIGPRARLFDPPEIAVLNIDL
ncbi:MAG TPA: metallophosphoesterase [Candidatus Bipolaricaulota bacterium]|nr:metallophosphoesterase [Candidatus Bipolaricaulota bacterium]